MKPHIKLNPWWMRLHGPPGSQVKWTCSYTYSNRTITGFGNTPELAYRNFRDRDDAYYRAKFS